jgi:hypothetical protein
MASVDRQNKLIAAEDWKKVYQSFKNADFKSYDFDNLRRTMITYLRENYPEDFNDYIESSEYLALIDLIAFLGQNLAFRFDLNARDNFLELAERRESVLRLARLLSYNPKRTQPANGILKFTSVSTTENIIDSNGRNLSGQTIVWNDSANTNWYEQFIKSINAALPENSQFGKPADSSTISGVPCEQYRFNASNTEIPVYGFSKSIDGRNMDFEVVSTTFAGSDKIYEEAPFPTNSLAFLYRDDGGGSPSSNTGFFLHFRQGAIQESTFSIERPGTSETVDIETDNINQTDVWLYGLDSIGFESDLWTKVDAVEGNNVIYNSINKSIRNIYSVLSRSSDRIRLIFTDGVFGNLPKGNFKVYYRTGNGLGYSINPNDIRNITIEVPYISRVGKQETITIALSLKYTVTNATAAETSDSIKSNAPATYYTQNRMITGEDYNVYPLSINQEIVKIKSINRVSSGISRYFDLKDSTGKYSTTNIFATDGVIYKQPTADAFTFSASLRTDIESIIRNQVEPILESRKIKDFYIDKFPSVNQGPDIITWAQQTSDINISTGVFTDANILTISPKRVGSYTSSNLKYVQPGSLLKFKSPTGYLFSKDGELVLAASARPNATDYIWSKVVSVSGDGTANNTGVLASGLGPIILNDIVPGTALLDSSYPKLVTVLEDSVRSRMVELIFANKEFGLRYDVLTTTWKLISNANINKKTDFSLGKAGDISNQQLDSSWIILFETNGETYSVTTRGVRYVFESEREVRFFFDGSDRVYDSSLGKVISDRITVLSINTKPNSALPIANDVNWEIVEDYKGADGYVDSKKISISFYDSDADGVIDNPEIFAVIVDPENTDIQNKFIFQKNRLSIDGVTDYYYISNDANLIRIFASQTSIDTSSLTDQQLVYIVDENVIKIYNSTSVTFAITTNYRAYLGRDKLKFQYVHAANDSVRLDPAATNIMDIHILTKSYDTSYRQWLVGDLATRPLPPSSDALAINFSSALNKIKAISDEIIYHPVAYKNLFGSKSDMTLQATFKVVKNSSLVISDNEIKSGVISAITEFFAIENWDFGDTFYFGELATYIMSQMSPKIANIVLVPRDQNLAFGSLYEIKSNPDEIFASSATVDNIEIISEITAARLNSTGYILTSTSGNQTGIISN